jgi:hypothetical protein
MGKHGPDCLCSSCILRAYQVPAKVRAYLLWRMKRWASTQVVRFDDTGKAQEIAPKYPRGT